MKHFFTSALAVSLFLFAACKSTSPTGPDTSKGTPTAVGTPVGTPVSATIGAAGGSVMSTDGRLEVVIPANALSAATNISIQPVTNETPQGTGLSFSLTPHGQQFSQPVTLRFHYKPEDLIGTDAEALAIATQKDDRIWYAYDTKTLDTTAGTLSVQSSSFSVKSLYQSLKISPAEATIKVNTSQEVTVNLISPIPADDDPNDELSALGSAIPYPNAEEITWSLNGSSLGSTEDGYVSATGNTSTATYHAPATTASMSSNPVAVTAAVDILGPSKYYLISNIKVLDSDSIRTYKITVDFTGTAMAVMSDFTFGYIDHGTFIISIYPNEDTARISSIVNVSGEITDWTEKNTNCTHAATGPGDLLHINSVTSVVSLRFWPYVHSSFTSFDYTTDCGQGPKTTLGGTYDYTYSAGPFLLDGTSQTITDVTSGNTTGVTVTMTLTPQ